ncbi:MAG: hypothetical protein MUF48_06905 [Pirellulaceae bacterium]|jgi:ribosomal protein L37E|nr:hypothetical protein [Pirellulaceae bacterium]
MSTSARTHGEDTDFLVDCGRRIRAAVREHCRCRECGERCHVFATVCETCGTQDPIRLPITWALWAVGISAAVLALQVWTA